MPRDSPPSPFSSSFGLGGHPSAWILHERGKEEVEEGGVAFVLLPHSVFPPSIRSLDEGTNDKVQSGGGGKDIPV